MDYCLTVLGGKKPFQRNFTALSLQHATKKAAIATDLAFRHHNGPPLTIVLTHQHSGKEEARFIHDPRLGSLVSASCE